MRVSDLSLREKIQQTNIIRVIDDQFNSDKVGGVFFGGTIISEANEKGVNEARNLIARYSDNADIPILATSDFENGCGSMFKGLTPFPYLMSLGAANNEETAYLYGKATAMEARSVGANWSLSPVSDLNINPRNPLVGVRSVGDDPELAVRLLKQVIRGMQENGIAACAKHFPGDGIDYRDQHIITTSNSLSISDWKKLSGKVFQELINNDVYSIMPGHINFPAYQKEVFENGLKLPATLSYELITNLLKNEMNFKGVVVTDALGMGGYTGWYDTRMESYVESFKAGCDMLLWPRAGYVEAMIDAVENGYISMERVDDAVSRILDMKEKLGLFKQGNHAIHLSEDDKKFVKSVQKTTAEQSITLVRDKEGIFPMSANKFKKIAVIPICHWEPAYEEAELLCSELKSKGFEVDYHREGRLADEKIDEYDLVIYALFSRSFRPMGFIDFMDPESNKIAASLSHGVKKSVVVSFGSPYYINQYFEKAVTYVNAYSFLSPSVKAFVRAATGEIEFTDFSPVNL